MDRLREFADRVAAKMHEARKIAEQSSNAVRFMAQFESNYRQFEQAANRLLTEIVQPRMGAVARLFPGARLRPAMDEHRCVAWFGYCQRFPATARVEFSTDYDPPLDQLILRYELRIVPSFLKYDGHDKLLLPLGNVDEAHVADWVEGRLLSFLDAYLRLDQGDEESTVALAIDPVCGMQVNAATAIRAEQQGHPYYFCSEQCRQRFVDAPKRFVRIEAE